MNVYLLNGRRVYKNEKADECMKENVKFTSGQSKYMSMIMWYIYTQKTRLPFLPFVA